MGCDKLLMVKNEKVIGEIFLSRSEKNKIEYFELQWNEENGCYAVSLSQQGDYYFQKEKKFEINDKIEIQPAKQYYLPCNSYIRRADAVKAGADAGTQLFLLLKEKQYLIVRRIEEGSQKKIYLAIDSHLNNTLVVLKLRRKGSAHFARFRRSAMLLSSISAYIPRIMDIGQQIMMDGYEYDYQAFEYFAGYSLDQKLPLEKDAAIKIFYHISLAIQDLHRANISHRNLKPEHILYDSEYNAKLVGLSLVKKSVEKGTTEVVNPSLDADITLSGTEPMELNVQESTPGQIIGNIVFAPISMIEKRKDIYCIASLFVYSLQETLEKRKKFLNTINSEKSGLTEKELVQKYLPDSEFPNSLIKILVEILVNYKFVKASELVSEFALSLGYVCNEITRSDQFPMPKEILIPGVESAFWYAPMEEVGGDFYNIIELSNGKYGILFGDTMGHGIKAYFYTHLIYPVAELFSDQQISPASLLEKMDRLLYKSGRGRGGYAQATALYGILSLDEYCPYFMYASAGHPFPILYRPASSQEEKSCAFYLKLENTPFTGTPLGMGMCRFLENFIRLQEGDILLFYTDGIIEKTNKNGIEYGYERLLSIVHQWADYSELDPLQNLIETLRTDVQNFAQSSKEKDDITVMAIKIGKLGKKTKK